MSTTIDKKVVEMRFDNKHFEKNVATTMSTLDKLKQSLDFTGASKGLDNLGNAAKNCDMSTLGDGVEAVRLKFSALQVMGITALQNITNSAVNAGKRIVSALTIDPVKTGFSEYETKINAIQTIMSNTASKGTTMEDVTRVIGELNTYADKTIYNFAEMTRNIGTFTAAGVGLEDSAAAIQGIANLAAASGSTSQQASTAMYQLSQALSSGTVKLMDWNSVVNAGMGGQKFQDALKATAREHGIAVDDLIKKNGSFRESLSEGWISADILNETLKKFTVEGATQYAESMVKSGKYTKEQADALIKEAQAMEDAATKVKTFTQLWDTLKESAQSGWAQTWEIIVGDFEEAKSFLTEVSDTIGGIIGKSAEARNEMLENWKVLGGRDDLLQSLRNAFEGISSVIKPISEAFREIFPPITSEQLFAFTEGLKKLTERMTLSESTSDKLKRTFKGLFAVVDIVRQVLVSAYKAVQPLFKTAGGLVRVILDLTAGIGDWVVSLSNAIRESGILDEILQSIVGVLEAVIDGVKNCIKAVKDTKGFSILASGIVRGLDEIPRIIEKLTVGIKQIFQSFSTVISKIASVISDAIDDIGSEIDDWSIFNVFEALYDTIMKIAGGIVKAISTLFKSIGSAFNVDGFSSVIDLVTGIIAGGFGVSIIKFINNLSDSIGSFKELIGNVTEIFGELGNVLKAYQTTLKADALMKIAAAIAVLALAVGILALIDSDRLYDSVVALGTLLLALGGIVFLLAKPDFGIKGLLGIEITLHAISTAILMMSIALKIISDIDPDRVTSGILTLVTLMGVVVGAEKILSKSQGAMIRGGMQMILYAAAVKVLASACADLADLSWEELAKGLVGVGVLMAEITAFTSTKGAKFGRDTIPVATGIVILASAIKILESVCEDFASMSWEEIGKGLLAVAVLFEEITWFTRRFSNLYNIISIGTGMVILASSIKILASAVQDMGHMTWDEIGRGLAVLAGSLLLITAATKNVPADIQFKSVGIFVMAVSLLVLADALAKLGTMTWEEIGKGLLVISIALTSLTKALGKLKMVGGSVDLFVTVLALGMLTPILIILGSLSWSSIAKGLVAIGGALAIIGIAGAALQPILPAILKLSAAVALFGAGALAMGVGLMAAGAGLAALATGITAISISIGSLLPLLVQVLVATVVGICEGLAEGIVAFCQIIIKGIPAIGEAIEVLVFTICDVLVECAPKIADTILKLVSVLLDLLVEYTPKIVDAIFRFLIGVIDSLGKNIPQLVQAVFDFIGQVIQGVIDAFKSINPDSLLKGIAAVGLMAGVIWALSAIVPLIPGAMVGVLGVGAIVAELAIVIGAIGMLAQMPGLEWLISEGGDLLETLGTAIGQFIGGLAGGIAKGFTGSLPEVAADLSMFMANLTPFIAGARMIDDSVLGGVRSLVDVILALTGANIIDSLTSWFTGGTSLADFGTEIAAFGPCIRTFADSVTGIDSTAVQAAASATKALADMTAAIPNEGGMVAWFTGENSVSKFGTDLVALGMGLKSFSDSIVGINPEAMTAAANAAKSIADMAATIPNEGGVIAWFAGENSVASFALDMVFLGQGLKSFSDAITGINPEAMVAAANAAHTLAEMTQSIPNSGGVTAWFAGENSVSKFSDDLVALGNGLKGFSDAIAGVNPEVVTAAANAAKALAEMTQAIPNEGGMVAWFTGENSLSKFSTDIITLGVGLKGFSDAVTGVNPETIMAAANAAKSLAEMSSYIPNEGGVVSWFTGENSISKFGADLIALGFGLKSFSDATIGINPESMMSAAAAAKSLAEMTGYIPNEGGVVSWFTGENSLSKFSSEIPALGKGLKGFSEAVVGINPEAVTSAAGAAKALAEMTAVIPKEGGIKAWFTGDTSIANFADKLPGLGKGLKGFSESVVGINPDNVTAAANAAKALAQMMETMPSNVSKVADFGTNVVKFGERLKSYFTKMSEIGEGSISSSKQALEEVKAISTLDAGNIKSVSTAIKDLSDAIKKMAKEIKTDLKNAGKEAIEAFINGIKDKTESAKRACKTLVTECAEAITNKSSAFKNAGRDLVKGFADGISENTYRAEAKSIAMAKAAAKAAMKALDINSPSKVFRSIGYSVPEGFAMGIDKFSRVVVDSSASMGDDAMAGVKDSIARIADLVNGDIDAQPTIRPVLDLSDVRSGASTIGDLFGSESVGLFTNVGAISSMMGQRNQNGANSELVSAIDKLRNDVRNMPRDTYQFGDITYSEGSEVAEAIQTLVRAMKVGGRT